MADQLALLPKLHHQFPKTRYQGSKAKLTKWIWDSISFLDFDTCLDAFGGTGTVSYKLKQEQKQVTYNDSLKFNYWIGQALVENSTVVLEDHEVDWILNTYNDSYPSLITETFQDIYYLDEENEWLDKVIWNIHQMKNIYKRSLAFFALAQACIMKRPYNLFHRKNLYVRTANVKRSFGNKSSWDRPFESWFRHFVAEANQAVFSSGKACYATNLDVYSVRSKYDLVYLDPPYISGKGVAVDFRDFYHFLEGLVNYSQWRDMIDMTSRHRRLIRQANDWTDRSRIYKAFERVFERHAESILVVSYRSDGIPSESELIRLLSRFKTDVRIERFRNYQYVLSKNKRSNELLLIGQ
ncbi:MAG: DNA adenine methylase [Chloroflexi bacterium]|nr:DNA adenine methylase [Chloroflexota bacterium]